MKDIKLETILRIAGIVFAAGMLYSNVTSSGEKTRIQLESTKEQIMDRIEQQEKRMDRIDDYLEAVRRNKL